VRDEQTWADGSKPEWNGGRVPHGRSLQVNP